jgi:hypothetical protein
MRARLAVVALMAIVAAGSAGASWGATGPGGETVTLEPSCLSYPPDHVVRITLTGFPPNSEVVGDVELPRGGHIGPVTVQTDASGRYTNSIGSSAPGTFRLTVQWSGGTLVESLAVNCGGPNGTPAFDQPFLEFETQQVGFFSAPRQTTVTNYGPGALTVHSIRLTGPNPAEFLIASDSCSGSTVPVGGSCFVRVRFGPKTTERRNAALALASSAASRPFFLYLGGQGVPSTVPEGRRVLKASVEPKTVEAGEQRCFRFQAHTAAGDPLARALVRFAGERTRTGTEGRATLCARFPYQGTRTARVRRAGFRSVLLRIPVLP